MKNKFQIVIISIPIAICLIMLADHPSAAQEDGSPVSIGTFRILYSSVLDEDRTLLVNLPKSYAESTMPYPVLYILYGGQVRGYFAESAACAVEKTMIDSGTDAGIAKYREIRADAQNRLYFDENEFNYCGYNLMGRGMIDAAIEVFKMNVEMYPQSANAHDSLAEAYLVLNNNKLALKHYRKSLVLNPDNTHTKEMLEKLEKNRE
ncbi:MAG: tetratricopeptide repeat protein [Candidatus Krumholzibacteriota bacterium]|nr:tetratricopeptide repeat protein [Candidatus Krumholzibacteriota bacterium]